MDTYLAWKFEIRHFYMHEAFIFGGKLSKDTKIFKLDTNSTTGIDMGLFKREEVRDEKDNQGLRGAEGPVCVQDF